MIIHRSLIYGALTLFVLVLYGGVVAIAQAVSRERLGLAFAVAAAAIVAVALAPLRDRVQSGVDRLLYGERRDPYGVLSRLSRRLEAAIAPGEVLTVVVETVAQALKLPYVAVELHDETGAHVEATYGIPGRTIERMPLHYRGEIIGDLVLGLRAGEEQFAPSDRRLLEDLGRQVGVAAHAVALTRALQRSRERLVAAREEERRRLRRDLHDGLGPALAGIALTLDAARRQLAQDPAAVEATLAEIREEAQRAIADIRRLVYDLRPPALDDLGLLGALREHVDRLDGSIRFSLDLPDRLPPLPAAVEVAAYRIVLEALTNVTRHAGARACTVRLSVNGALTLEVRDDGRGLPQTFRPGVGLASMRERAAELGGDCTIERANGRGMRVTAVLPLERA